MEEKKKDIYPTTDHCRHYLPHIENKRYQMITFRLYDSVPKQVIEQWKMLGTQEGTQVSPPAAKSTEEIATAENCALSSPSIPSEARKYLILLDKYEDAGYGQCFMKDDRVAQIVYDSLIYNDNKRYDLVCWCIMPNHVHVLISPYANQSLSKILYDWRSYTTYAINKVLNRTGKVWMAEYFDRYIRDVEHFNKTVNYIHNNPVKAGIAETPDSFRWSSAYRGIQVGRQVSPPAAKSTEEIATTESCAPAPVATRIYQTKSSQTRRRDDNETKTGR